MYKEVNTFEIMCPRIVREVSQTNKQLKIDEACKGSVHEVTMWDIATSP